MSGVRRALVAAFLSGLALAGCGGNVVVDADEAAHDRCDDVPLPTSVEMCDGTMSEDLCSVVQCDEAGNRYELRCSPTGCDCLYNGEVMCSGKGDYSNTCPNGIRARVCPGISWAVYQWPPMGAGGAPQGE